MLKSCPEVEEEKGGYGNNYTLIDCSEKYFKNHNFGWVQEKEFRV